MKKIILFDIDGTLLYTGGAGQIAFEKAFQELYGVSDVWQNLIPDGKTDPAIIDEIVCRVIGRSLKQEEEKKLALCYHEHFEREIQNPPKFEILPGVTELLEKLSRRPDILLGIVTGNFEQAAWAKLRQGGLDVYFQFGGFASDHANRVELTRIGIERGRKILGPHHVAAQVFIVGDTPHDVHAGKSLGVPVIAVATGRTAVNEFYEKFNTDYALENLSDHERFFKIIESHPMLA